MSVDATTLERLLVRIGTDASKYHKGMDSVVTKATKVAGKMNTIGTVMSLGITLPLAGVAGGLVKAASDAEETASKFEAVFKNVSGEAAKAAAHLDEFYGTSSTGAKRMLADTGDLLTGFGFADKAALDMAFTVQKLSTDLASFQNLEGGAERASRILTKALVGNKGALDELGITANETSDRWKELQAQFERKGMSEAQAKAMTVLTMATEQSKNAMGDYARTQDGFANQTRETAADIADMASAYGKLLVPAAKQGLQLVQQLTKWVGGLSDTQKIWAVSLAAVAAAAGPVLWISSSLVLRLKDIYTASVSVVNAWHSLINMASSMGRVISDLAAPYIAHKRAIYDAAIEYAKWEELYHRGAITGQVVADKQIASLLRISGGLQNTTTALIGHQAATGVQTTLIAQHYATMATAAASAMGIVVAAVTEASAGLGMARLTTDGYTDTMARASGETLRLTGTVHNMARGTNIVDASFTRVHRSSTMAAGTMARMRAVGNGVTGMFAAMGTSITRTTASMGLMAGMQKRMVSLKAGASAFKVELALLAGVIAFKLTTALTGANAQYRAFDKNMKLANKLASKQQEALDTRLSRFMEKQSHNAPAKRAEAIKKELERYKIELKGTQRAARKAAEQLEELEAGWLGTGRSLVGNKNLAAQRKQVEITEAAAEAAARRVKQLQDAIFSYDLESGAKQEAARAAAKNKYLERMKQVANEAKATKEAHAEATKPKKEAGHQLAKMNGEHGELAAYKRVMDKLGVSVDSAAAAQYRNLKRMKQVTKETHSMAEATKAVHAEATKPIRFNVEGLEGTLAGSADAVAKLRALATNRLADYVKKKRQTAQDNATPVNGGPVQVASPKASGGPGRVETAHRTKLLKTLEAIATNTNPDAGDDIGAVTFKRARLVF